MSSGRPDYFRGVDITYQTLGQITNRPKYGGAVVYNGGDICYADVETPLIAVAGKGMVYGLVMYLDYTSTQKNSYISVEIDDSLDLVQSFRNLNKFGNLMFGGYPLAIYKFDDVKFIYSVGLVRGITFEESFIIRYGEQHSTTPTVYCYLSYALI